MHSDSCNGEAVDKYPDDKNNHSEFEVIHPVLEHHGKEGVDSNKETKHTAGHIARAHKPSLSPTRRGANEDTILHEPAGVEQEGERLLQIRNDQVVYEQYELAGRMISPYPRCNAPCENEEESDAGKEGKKAHGGHGSETTTETKG